MLELSALLEEELPRALDGYSSAVYQTYYMKQWLGDEEYNQVKVQELWQSSQAELREADKVAGERMARLNILYSRIKQSHPRAPYWGRLSMLRVKLQVAVGDIEVVGRPEDAPKLDGEACWDEKRETLRTALGELRVTHNEIANPIKPPPRQLAHRVRQEIKRQIEKWRQERRKCKELDVTPTSDTLDQPPTGKTK